MKKSVLAVKVVLFVVGVILILQSGVLNELQLSFNEAEGWIGLTLIFLSLLRKIRTTIQELI